MNSLLSRFHSSGLAKLATALVLNLVAVRAIAASPFRAGDILYTDSFGAVLRLSTATGERTIVASGGKLAQPFGIAVDANGDLIVANVGSPSEIVRVNPRNGVQTIVSQGSYLRNPRAIAVNGNDVYVTDVATPDGNFGIGIVIHVDLSTGSQTVLASGGNLVGPVGIAVDPNGQLVVGDPYTINPESRD